MKVRLEPGSTDTPTFVEASPCYELENLEADAAVTGVPCKSPCQVNVPLEAAAASSALSAPETLHRRSAVRAQSHRHYDFGFDGDLFAGREVRIADCGNLDL